MYMYIVHTGTYTKARHAGNYHKYGYLGNVVKGSGNKHSSPCASLSILYIMQHSPPPPPPPPPPLHELQSASSSSCVPGTVATAMTEFEQFLHLQPGPHSFVTQQQRVEHAVTLECEQPQNSNPTPSRYFLLGSQ